MTLHAELNHEICRGGVSESIRGRLERAGGTAAIHTEIGAGTEIELRLPRSRS